MTSATVTQLGEMLAGISNTTGNMDTQNGEFAGIFQTAAQKSEGTEIQETVTTKTSATEKTMGVSKTADKLRETKTEEKPVEPQDMEAVEKELETAVEELKEEIAEKLDITVEELELVMENLGLNDASLFTQEGMTALVMEVEQISTPVDLITNADVYQTLQELNTFASELLENVQNEFQLTDTQLQNALETLAVTEEATTEIPVEEVQLESEETDAEITKETKNAADADVENTTVEDKQTAQENTLQTGRESKTGEEGKEQHASQNQQMTADNTIQSNNTQTVNQTTTDFSQNIAGNNLSAQEIYDQIGEYVKTQVKPGISEVEMQLNPESLGTLHIHLSSKQGNVTAQLTVQNELVKAALEVQLIQLKETFAEQGIRVEAVEVTVESHAFDQNMQQGNEENTQAQAEAKRVSTRRINLNENWMEEELTEEEQLVAEMMEANGNTVDYMA